MALAIVEDQHGRVLLMPREDRLYAGYFGLPGGKFFFSEDTSEAALRELGEETGLHRRDLSPIRLTGISLEKVEVVHQDDERVRLAARWQLYYHFTKLEREGLSLPKNCRWFTYNEIQSANSVIPSLVPVVRLMPRINAGEVDFFFFEDTLSQIGGRLFLTRSDLQLFRRVEYSVSHQQSSETSNDMAPSGDDDGPGLTWRMNLTYLWLFA